jgi:flagellar biosynthesis protein FliQ
MKGEIILLVIMLSLISACATGLFVAIDEPQAASMIAIPICIIVLVVGPLITYWMLKDHQNDK